MILKWLKKALAWILLIPVYFYRWGISPFTPSTCRHTPTCSQYTIEAIKIHGPFKGFWMGLKRLSKCHPWGTQGYDPVPIVPIKTFKASKKRPAVKLFSRN